MGGVLVILKIRIAQSFLDADDDADDDDEDADDDADDDGNGDGDDDGPTCYPRFDSTIESWKHAGDDAKG